MKKTHFIICLAFIQIIMTSGLLAANNPANMQETENNIENIFLLTPSSKSLKAISDELFMIHFKENVEMDTNQSIFIYYGNGTLFEEIKLNSDNVIDIQTKRIMFDASNNFELDSNYYINFSEIVFSDSTSIVDDSTWSFTCGLKLTEVQLYSPAIEDSIRLMIALPENYSADTDSTYPVVYITDGGFFNHGQYSEIANAGALNEAKDYVIVGIAYPRKYTINDVRQFRRRDLVDYPDRLQSFLNDSIIPFIDLNYRTKQAQNTLIGNSNGGYFATYVLTSYRENNNFQFKNIFAVAQLDPFIIRERAMAAEINDLPINFYLAVGEKDGNRIYAYNRLKDTLICRQYPSLGFEFKMYEGMPHGEVSAAAAFYDAFRLTEFTKLRTCEKPVIPTSLSENKSNNLRVNVYPNPVSNVLHVNIQNDELKDINLSLYNSIGKLIYQENLRDNNYSLDVNQFSKGLYLLFIESEDDIVTEKIIIK